MVKAVYVLMKRRKPLICVKNDRKLKEKKKKSVEKNFEKTFLKKRIAFT